MAISSRNIGRLLPILLVLVSLVFVSCDGTSNEDLRASLREVQGEFGFVGTVSNSDAFVALLIDDMEAIVVLCSGDEEIYEWFRGPITDPTDFTLTNSDGASVTARFRDGAVSGQVVLRDASAHSFSAAPGTGEESGIYRIVGDVAAENDIEGCWIVDSDHQERGAFWFRNKVTKPRPRPRPRPFPTDGTSNTVLFGEFSLQFTRLSLPL